MREGQKGNEVCSEYVLGGVFDCLGLVLLSHHVSGVGVGRAGLQLPKLGRISLKLW